MAALRDGAKEVIAIDKDAHALALCRENYVLNGFHSPFSTMEGDAFLLLETLGNRKERFNIITLDPPSLIKRKAEIYRGRDFFSTCVKKYPSLGRKWNFRSDDLCLSYFFAGFD